MKRILSILIVFIINGCSDYALDPGPYFADLSVYEARQMIERNQGNPKFILLDVRTESEFAAGYLANAVLLDFRNPHFATELRKFDQKSRYLVYCGSGIRSAHACEILKESGFVEAYNMLGGINDWKAAGYPLLQ